MYSSRYCPFCVRARDLLASKGVEFTEIDVDTDPQQRSIMFERSGRTSVPQVFIGERHVGGSDDLAVLDRQGALDPLLTNAGAGS